MKNIISDDKGHYFCMPFNSKVHLPRGLKAFEECADLLKKTVKLNALTMDESLKLPFPDKNPEMATNRDHITSSLLNLANEIKDKYTINWFHYDNNIKNAQTSTVLQLVDDNNSKGERRKHLLDPSVKYIGINVGQVKKNIYCIYLVFAS
jgi:hypothetical protein